VLDFSGSITLDHLIAFLEEMGIGMKPKWDSDHEAFDDFG
jgi:hypothetical protein